MAELPGVRVERNLMIPLSDGVSLAAGLHLPEGKGPFPTLISYYPYHKDDYIAVMCEYPCRYFAEQGYANLVVDFRGTGGSTGLSWEPFDPREHNDGAEIVEWAARQPWCDGNIGMWGISYGGITSLQTASQNPPHLKAIFSQYACVDPYHDFVYPGGCLNCLSADSEGRWYRLWKERLEKSVPYTLSWQDHPDYDDYWQSRVIPVEKISIPTFLIGSWRDLFPEAMVRLYEQLSVPKKLLMGPWSHIPPDLSLSLEPVDHLQEMLRWWDYWLKGEKNDVMDEPPVTLFVQGANTWKHENEWPITRGQGHTLFLSGGKRLADKISQNEESDTYRANPSVGAMAGLWDLMALGVGYPLDQGPDDLLSLAYTSDPLQEDREISGSPEAVLYIALESEEEANLVAKLNEVRPDGSSSLITTGWLKASHRHSHERPEPLQPGKVVEYRIALWATSYLVSKGHRLRLSISCSDFPRIFPTSTNPEIRLFFGGTRRSSLRIPVVPAPATPLRAPQIRRPEPAVNRVPSMIDALPKWTIEQDFITDTLTITAGLSERFSLPSGGTVELEHTSRPTVAAIRPDGAKVTGDTAVNIHMPAGEVIQIETKSVVSQTKTLLTGKITLDGQIFFEKQWER